jgi:hypothetical protein
MIPSLVLKYLILNRIRDAEALFKNGRYAASIYFAGYAAEIALKNKICGTLQFNSGFPETRQELSTYLQHINRNNPVALRISLGEIRNHDLAKLLFYSGAELRIQSNFYKEWNIVKKWNPENRYKKIRVTRIINLEYLQALKKIIKEIA